MRSLSCVTGYSGKSSLSLIPTARDAAPYSHPTLPRKRGRVGVQPPSRSWFRAVSINLVYGSLREVFNEML
jgi:hypothetical protein